MLLLLLPATLLSAHSVGPALAHNIIPHTMPFSPTMLDWLCSTVGAHAWQDIAHQ
jgi:hypothetical protein